MALELFANNATTSLNGAIDNAVTTVTVTDASLFPATGNFRLLIGSELLLVTAVSGNDFTVARGIEGTTAASHADTTAVNLILTNAGLLAFRADAILTGAYGSLPAAGVAGRVYLPNDGHYLLRDSGSAWAAFGPLRPLTPPVSGDFAWINQGGAAVATTGGVVALTAPASGTKNARIRKKTAPSTPYTITALFRVAADPSDYWNAGLIFRNSVSGKFAAFQLQQVTTLQLSVDKFTDSTTFSANYKQVDVALVPAGLPFWMRIADDGTSRICSFSADGVNWQVFHTVGRTDFLTADEVGFYVNSENSKDATMTLISWKEG